MKTIAFGDHSKPGFSLYLVKLAARSRGRCKSHKKTGFKKPL